MSGFTPANPLGWAPKDPVKSAQLNHLDQQLVKAVNGVDGGAYDGPLQLSDVELMKSGAGGIHGDGKIDITGSVTSAVIQGHKYQPESVPFQNIDTSITPSCTLDFTANDTFLVELSDSTDQFALAMLASLVFKTSPAAPDHELKRGGRFSITFVAASGQKGGCQLGPNAWPANVRFRSQTDRILDGTDENDLTTYELVNRGTPQSPIFDVVGVYRGIRA